MPKSTKHQDKVGTFESFLAPWETQSGGEVDVDKPTLKRLLFNLKVGEAKALDAQDDAKVTVAEAETARDEAKEQAANANPAEAQKQIDKLTKQVGDLTAERDGLVKAKEQGDLRAKVLEGVDPKVAKYVRGETEDELKDSLKGLLEDFGIEGGDDDDDDTPNVRNSPRARTKVTNPGDKSGKGGEDEVDYDAVAAAAISQGITF